MQMRTGCASFLRVGRNCTVLTSRLFLLLPESNSMTALDACVILASSAFLLRSAELCKKSLLGTPPKAPMQSPINSTLF